MTDIQDFKTITRALSDALRVRGLTLTTYELLEMGTELHDRLTAAGLGFSTATSNTQDDLPPLVRRTLDAPVVMEYLRGQRKIHAIKELRGLAGCSLSEAKDAVEHRAVTDAAGLPPYEPPFRD